jgi:hypothetical protein
MDREQALQRLSLISSKLFRANSISAAMFEYLSFARAFEILDCYPAKRNHAS